MTIEMSIEEERDALIASRNAWREAADAVAVLTSELARVTEERDECRRAEREAQADRDEAQSRAMDIAGKLAEARSEFSRWQSSTAIVQERDAAIASRNAWVETAADLKEALEEILDAAAAGDDIACKAIALEYLAAATVDFANPVDQERRTEVSEGSSGPQTQTPLINEARGLGSQTPSDTGTGGNGGKP